MASFLLDYGEASPRPALEFRNYPDRRTAVQTVLKLDPREHQTKRQHMKNYAACLQDSMASSDLRWQQTHRATFSTKGLGALY